MAKTVNIDIRYCSGYASLSEGVHTAQIKSKYSNLVSNISDTVSVRIDHIPQNYLSFESPTLFRLYKTNPNAEWDGTLFVSTDTLTWTQWDGTIDIDAVLDNGTYKLYICGANNTYVKNALRLFGYNNSNPSINVSGNIETLLDYLVFDTEGHVDNYGFDTFYDLFQGSRIVNASNLVLSKLDLSETQNVYAYMFSGCSYLTTPPALPATTLGSGCYAYMFSGCLNLTTPPALPSINLANNCYQGMFRSCTDLENVSSLPATTLAKGCYSSMFENCTSLENSPTLPAIVMAQSCYSYMFKGCSSLKTTPVLSSTQLAQYCYYGMFENCTSLTSLPLLPATNLENYCYAQMFKGCSKIKLYEDESLAPLKTSEYIIPSSGIGNIANGALNDMFINTGGSFTGTPEINTIYYLTKLMINESFLTFSSNNQFMLNKTNISYDGKLAFSTDKVNWTVWDSSMPTITSENNKIYLLGLGNTRVGRTIDGNGLVFSSIWNIEVSVSGNIDTLLDYDVVDRGGTPNRTTYTFARLFRGCTKLLTAPTLPCLTMQEYGYYEMFKGCTALTACPALPATTLASNCYQSMFSGCSSIVSTPTLNATPKNSSYREMFASCTSLTTIDFPASVFDWSEYNYACLGMFMGCTALETGVPIGAKYDFVAYSVFKQMFALCANLKHIGKITCNGSMSEAFWNLFDYCSNVKVSTTQTKDYPYPFKVVSQGSIAGSYAFNGTGGSYKGDLQANIVYFLADQPVPYEEPTILLNAITDEDTYLFRIKNNTGKRQILYVEWSRIVLQIALNDGEQYDVDNDTCPDISGAVGDYLDGNLEYSVFCYFEDDDNVMSDNVMLMEANL